MRAGCRADGALPTLLPEGVLSAEGEDAQAVKSSWETASSPLIEPGGVGAAWLAAEQSRVLAPPVAHHLCPFGAARRGRGKMSSERTSQVVHWLGATWWPALANLMDDYIVLHDPTALLNHTYAVNPQLTKPAALTALLAPLFPHPSPYPALCRHSGE